jgi:hypothetical protein
MSLEQRIAVDLRFEDVQHLLNLAAAVKGEASVRDAVRARIPGNPPLEGFDLNTWVQAGSSETELRSAIGKAAQMKGWFKDRTRGEALGALLAGALPAIPASPLALLLREVEAWVYAN